MRIGVIAACVAALASPGIHAQGTDEIKALRTEVEALRADYEARLKLLEDRLRAAESASLTPAPAQVPRTSATPPSPSAAASAPVPATAGGASSFNPSIGLILSGAYVNATRDPALYTITGFPLPPDAEAGLGKRGFTLSETELSFAANIDPWLSGRATVALAVGELAGDRADVLGDVELHVGSSGACPWGSCQGWLI